MEGSADLSCAAAAPDAARELLGADGLIGFLCEFRTGGGVPCGDNAPAVDTAGPAHSSDCSWAEATSRYEVVREDPDGPWVDDPYSGSETQVGPEWWMASDGRWYPPELHPDACADPASGQAGPEPAAEEPERPASPPVGNAARARLPLGVLGLRRLRHSPA